MSIMSGKRDGNRKDIAPAVSKQIDENLKRLYSDAASEELPKSLTDLLDALRQQDAQKKAGEK